MQRRTFLALIALPAMAPLLQSCGDETSSDDSALPPDTTNPSANVSSLRSDVARITATAADGTVAGAAINAFGADLYARLLAASPTDNLVFSPASIAIALAMTSAGAKGATLSEMDTVLHIDDPTEIHRAMNGLTAQLMAANKSKSNASEGGTGTSEVQLSIANSLWGQFDLPFAPAFLDQLAAEYGAGMQLVDYTTDPEAARTAINAWVDDETRERIPELIGPGFISTDTRLTLVNAVYLKAQWDQAFSKELTLKEPFTTVTGGEVQVDMMHSSASRRYGSGSGWQAVELPYVFGDLAFVVAVGDTLDASLPTADDVLATLAERPVELGFPRFDIETSTELAQVLSDMGMSLAFAPDEADFSGITTAAELFISAVIHQANITVDEVGTEAAAATAVVMDVTSAPEPVEPVTLTIDRPFTFWLREQATGAVVFMGRVTDPSQTRS